MAPHFALLFEGLAKGFDGPIVKFDAAQVSRRIQRGPRPMLLSRRRAHVVRVRWKELADASIGEFVVCAAIYRFYGIRIECCTSERAFSVIGHKYLQVQKLQIACFPKRPGTRR